MRALAHHTLLTNLVTLTNERDDGAIIRLLGQSIFDLLSQDNSGNTHTPSVRIYHTTDIEKRTFSALKFGNYAENDALSPHFEQALIDCVATGEHQVYTQKNQCYSHLHPLKNAHNRTIAVVEITSVVNNADTHEVTSMLLQVFQNYSWLNHDNERDTLTGLLNRKSFDQKINKVINHISNKAKRTNDPIDRVHFLAVFDIDHFKNVNDSYGHLIGDEVLLLFSQLITQCFRDTDMIFRFGGEEFVGVFECARTKDIATVLERFRVIIADFSFPQIGKVTVSAGYTAILANEISSQLIDRADQALYFAKSHGRNRICGYENLIQEGLLKEDKNEGEIVLF
jgi:diguanylate cyclase (GGDEF)-like protein